MMDCSEASPPQFLGSKRGGRKKPIWRNAGSKVCRMLTVLCGTDCRAMPMRIARQLTITAGLPGRVSRRAPRRGRAGPPPLYQLIPAAETIEHAERPHAVVARADNIMAAVADHQRGGRVDTRFGQRVLQQIALVDARAVELRAEHMLEIRAELKMIDDARRVDARLAGRHEQPAAAVGKRSQRRLD